MLAVVPVDVRRDLLCGMDVDHVDDAWSLWSSAAEQGLPAACAHGGGPLPSEDPGARWLGWVAELLAACVIGIDRTLLMLLRRRIS